MRNCSHIIMLPILIAITASCSSKSERISRFYTKLMDAKKESVHQWEEHTPLGYIGIRTAIILKGAEHLTLTNSHVTAEGGFRLNYRIDKDQAAEMTIGSAVPIRTDGYFLTALHCVDGDSDTLISLVEDEESVQLIKTGFRIVWASEDKEMFDLALIHADIKPFKPFEFADFNHLKENQLVAATGWSGLTSGDPNSLAGMAVGNLLSYSHIGYHEGEWRRIQHTIPLHPGDSGGPCVNELGQLIGINAKVQISLREQFRSFFKKNKNQRPTRGYIAYSSTPDPQWLETIIQSDRNRTKL